MYLLVSDLNNAKMTVNNFSQLFRVAEFCMTGCFIDSDLEHGNFLNTDISQSSVGKQLRCGGIGNQGFVANLLVNLSVKEF